METKELLSPFFHILDGLSNGFVVKDFVGFLNWEPAIGAVLLAYTGHHSEFCTAVKQNADVYARCVLCSDVHHHICKREKAPFCRPCFLGVSEYSVPIMIDDFCIGSISAGHFCYDRRLSAHRISALCDHFEIDEETLLQCFDSAVGDMPPSDHCKVIINFTANYLAEIFRPYSGRIRTKKETQNAADTGFELIQKYIHHYYTDPNISVGSIARACHYSQSYISHTFSQRMKIGFRSYVNQLRIILAKHELRNGHNVSFTAMVCGFNDANYFSKVFQSLVGVPPSQYAKHSSKRDESNSKLPQEELLLLNSSKPPSNPASYAD